MVRIDKQTNSMQCLIYLSNPFEGCVSGNTQCPTWYRLLKDTMTYACPCRLNIKHNFEMKSNADDIEKTKTFINTNVNRSKTITFMYTKPPKNINYLEQT